MLFWTMMVTGLLVTFVEADSPSLLCTLYHEPAAGLESESLRPALDLERRKARLSLYRIDVFHPNDCPSPCLPNSFTLSIMGTDAELRDCNGPVFLVDTTDVHVLDRAQEVARLAVYHIVSWKSVVMELVDKDFTIRPTANRRRPTDLSVALSHLDQIPEFTHALKLIFQLGLIQGLLGPVFHVAALLTLYVDGLLEPLALELTLDDILRILGYSILTGNGQPDL